MLKTKLAASAALIAMLSSTSALASDKDIEALRAEIQSIKQTYEGRIAELESKLNKVESLQAKSLAPTRNISTR